MGKWKFSEKINKTKGEKMKTVYHGSKNGNIETITAHTSTHQKNVYMQVALK